MDDSAAVNILQDQTHRLLASRPKCSSGVPRPHSNRKGLAKFGVHQHMCKCWALSQNMKMSFSNSISRTELSPPLIGPSIMQRLPRCHPFWSMNTHRYTHVGSLLLTK